MRGPGVFLGAWLAALALAGPAAALDVVTVPWHPAHPNSGPSAIPHPAYNGHPTMLKAIARGFSSLAEAGSARFRWDTDADGSFADEVDEVPRQCVAGMHEGTNCYDLGRRITIPTQATSRRLDFAIQVTVPGRPPAFGVYPVYVDATVPAQTSPSSNATAPTSATAAQLEVMRDAAIDDALWYLHLQLGSRAGTGAGLSGIVASPEPIPATIMLPWVMSIGGHRPAYPPGTYDHAVNPGGWHRPPAPPSGFDTANDARYRSDPYAEDAMRAINHLLSLTQAAGGVPAADEADDGRTPVPGTNDGISFGVGRSVEEVFPGDFAVLTALGASGLEGTVAQVGNASLVRGRSIEYIAQQFVDEAVVQQIKRADDELGGWYYDRSAVEHEIWEAAWILIGLDAAERGLGGASLIVPNALRSRLVNILFTNQDPSTKLARWRNHVCTGTGDLGYTGTSLLGGSLLGFDTFGPLDTAPAGTLHTGVAVSRGQARQLFDSYLNAVGTHWVSFQTDCHPWVAGLFYNDGGSGTPYLRTDGRGNTNGIFMLAHALKRTSPETLAASPFFGTAFGQRDWQREFSTYFVRNQRGDGSWLDAAWPHGTQRSVNYLRETLTTEHAAAALLPLDPGEAAPVAVGLASPSTVLEGCSGPSAGGVAFSHSGSFVRTPARSIVRYEWDFDYDGAFAADFATASASAAVQFVYELAGPYTARLRVTDDAGATGVHDVPVTVQASANAAPSAVIEGGPFVIDAFDGLVLDGRASSDPNEACGDTLSFSWDLNGDGAADATGAAPVLSWAQLAAAGVQLAHPLTGAPANNVRLTVTDSKGLQAAATTTLTVYGSEPVAVIRAAPRVVPISVVTGDASASFDGTRSYHGSPRGTIVAYEWDFDYDGVGFDVDSTGGTPTRLFSGPGDRETRVVALRVTDGAGSSSIATETLTFDAPPTPPHADAGRPSVVALGRTVTLDGSGSFDPDADNGDFLSRAVWEINERPECRFESTGSPASLVLSLTAAQLAACDVDEPGIFYTVKLTVTDAPQPEQASASDSTTLLLFRDEPLPVVSADKANVGCDVEVAYSAAGSRHGNPARSIVGYEWDFDYNGAFFVPDATGITTRHTYLASGAHLTALRVTDDNAPARSAIATVQTTVTFANVAPAANAGGPYVTGFLATGATPVTLDGRSSSDPNAPCDSIVAYEWDIDNDGLFGSADTNGAGAIVNGVPLEGSDLTGPVVAGLTSGAWVAGTQAPIALRVTDGFGVRSTASATLIVRADPPPTVDAGGPYEIAFDADLVLDVTVSDPAGDSVLLTASFGTPVGSTTVETPSDGSPVTVQLTIPAASHALPFGDHVVTVTADDGQGPVVFDTAAVSVVEAPPLRAVFEANPNPAACNQPVRFDGSGSTGPIADYRWDFGDGTAGGGAEATHAYARFGTFTATLTVADAGTSPKTDSAVREIVVSLGNRPPTALHGGPYGIDSDQQLFLNGDGVDPDLSCGDAMVSFVWDLDNDGLFDDATGAKPVLSPLQLAALGLGVGTRPIALRVTDSFGAQGTAQTTLSIYDNRPFAAFAANPNPAACNQTVSFDGRSSSHGRPDRSIVSYQWDFGDGVTGSGAQAPHAYTAFGSYTATLTVTDNNVPAKTAVATQVVDVRLGNVGPAARAGGPYAVAPGGDLALDGTASTDPNAGCGDFIVSYAWDLNNDGSFGDAVGAAPTVTALQLAALGVGPGPLTVRLRVTDSFGLTGTDTAPAVVYSGEPIASASIQPNPAACGQPVSFDGSRSLASAPGRTITEYRWDFGDSTSATGASVEHTYTSFGEYTATLTVTDDDVPAKTGSEATIVSVSLGNVPPLADAGGPYVADAGTSLTLDASGSTDENLACGDSLTFAWDLDHDGAFDDATGVAPKLSPEQVGGQGQRALRVRVTDTFGLSSIDEAILTVFDNRPVAVLIANPNPAACRQSVTFDGTESFHRHPERAIVAYAWDFGDGQKAAGARVTHAYGVFGAYTATLSVTDNNVPAKTATETIVVSVSLGNTPPVARHGGPYVADLGAALALDGTASSDPDAACGDAIVSYQWDIDNDGVFEAAGPAPMLSPLQLAALGAGPRALALRVTDGFGTSSTAVTTLTIYDNRPFPAFAASPNPAACEQAVSFDGSSSAHGRPDRSIVTYQWDFGDGTSGSGAQVTHAYSAFGAYTATLSVTDNNVPPRTATATHVVTVDQGNRPPLADAGGPYVAVVGFGVLTLDASASSEPDAACGDSIASYAWDLDGDGSFDDAAGPVVTLGPLARGAFGWTAGTNAPVRLRVTDAFGVHGVDAPVVEVVDNTPPRANAGGPYAVAEGGTVAFTGTVLDDEADPVTAAWDLDNDGIFETLGETVTFSAAGLDGPALRTVRLRGCDDKGACGVDETTVQIDNVAPAVDAGGDAGVGENTPFTRRIAFIDPGPDQWFATIDWGDGATEFLPVAFGASAFDVAHAYAREGDYTVLVSVTDDDGGSDTKSFRVTVVNVAPQVAAGADALLQEGDTLTGGGSFADPGLDTWSATVDYGDGTAGALALAPDKTFDLSHVYADNGTYTVTVTVVDGDGGVGTDSFTATVENVAPSVSAGPDQTAAEGAPVSVAATFIDPGADTHVAAIDWGDGTAAQPGPSGTHVYADDGTYTVTVTVTDDDGAAGSDTLLVSVENVAPSVDAGADRTVEEGDLVELTAAITDPGAADTHTVEWAFGDGSTASGPAASHVYADNGTYTVTVTVTDDDGASDSDTLEVTAENAAPEVDAGPDLTQLEGARFELRGTFTDKGAADTHTATIDWGDGSSVQPGLGGGHVYEDNGVYVVTITVVDDDGGLGTDTARVTVENVAPSVSAGPDQTAAEGAPVSVAATFTDPGADTHAATIDWGDGSSVQPGLGGTHVYADNGVYTVTVTVVDDDGGVGTDTTTVSVDNVAPTVAAGPDQAADEGAQVSVAATFVDPGADTHAATIDWGDGSAAQPGLSGSHVYADNGTYTVTVTVTDDDGGSGADTLAVTVANVAPVIDSFAVAPAVVEPGAPVSAAATFNDPGSADTHTVAIDWGDGATTPALAGTHAYSSPGIYTVTVSVTDDDGGQATRSASLVVVDREAHVSGAAHFDTSGGPAKLTLNVRYKQKDAAPSGPLRFEAPGVDFQATRYDWLTAVGNRAVLQARDGTGRRLLVSALDGSPDRVRVRLLRADGTVEFDSQPGAPDTAAPTTALAGGSLVVRS